VERRAACQRRQFVLLPNLPHDRHRSAFRPAAATCFKVARM
jgi:hypothetical protein